MAEYGLIILGGGPAGYRAAEVAAKKMRTLLIEKADLGGVCLNSGCIPSKTFLQAAKVADYGAHAARYGVRSAGAEPDHAAVVARKTKVVRTLTAGVRASVKSAGADIIKAAGYIEGLENGKFAVTAAGEKHYADNLLIACGSEAVVLPIKGIEEARLAGRVVTNAEIFSLKELPSSLVIIGGGVVGAETASYFASAGSKVTVIEATPRLLGSVDRDVAEVITKALTRKGVRFITSSTVTEITPDGVICSGAENGFIEGDKILLSAGRRAVTEGYGLENLGVVTTRAGITTDKSMRTNVKGVYAAGDVNGKSMLAHTAYREAEAAVNDMLGIPNDMLGIPDEVNYGAVPSVIYTSPEGASVGITAETEDVRFATVKIPAAYSGRYVAECDERDGFLKLIADRERGILAGAHAAVPYAGEIINAATALIALKTPVEQAKKIVFPHPTVAELMKTALDAL